MLLVLDVGNTTTVIGIFKGTKFIKHWRLVSERRTSDEFGIYLLNLLKISGIEPAEIDGAILSSVVPPLDAVIREGIWNYVGLECQQVSADMALGIKVQYENPEEVGADRLANSVAGVDKYGAPLIIVDFGTAVTLDIISASAEYLGGTISPGLVTSMDALFGKTSKLPQVALDVPDSVIGRTTRTSIQAGIMYGMAGLVDSLVRRIWKELGEKGRVVATGGHAAKVAAVSDTIEEVDPWLTLEGLRLIFERNRSRRESGRSNR